MKSSATTKKKSKSALVVNKEPVVTANHSIQKLTLNLLPANCRLETLEGRPHTVIPMVILVEGVHNGSNGPLLYTAEEMSKIPAVWNAKPVVVYHPEINGQGISACDPVVMNNRKVGIMMNTKFDKGRLTSEAWIEAPRADAVDTRIMLAVKNNDMMEVSTGLFVDTEATAGEWNGEAYTGIARNFRPDHLALLPDKVGACSIKDGAGFLRNEAKKGKNFFMAGIEKIAARYGLAENEMSFSNIREDLAQELRKKFNANTDKGPFLWVEDVYSNFVVYEFDGKLFRLGYTASDTGVTLSDETPTEVTRVTEYRTVSGAFVGNREPTETQKSMKKEQKVTAIITANAGWSESDRASLMAFTDQQIDTIHSKVAAPPAAPPATTNSQPATTAPAAAPATAPAVTTAPAPAPATNNVITLEGYISSAPKELQAVLRNSLDSYGHEKNSLIAMITKNEKNVFTKEELETMDNPQLRKLAHLAAVPATAPAPHQAAPMFWGQAPVTDNTQAEEALPLPTMNFEPAAKK